MKMNERCKRRIECEHSSVLSFRGISESFLLRCSAFVIKFNPRLSQLQPIDSLYLFPSVSLFCFSPSLAFFSLLLPLRPSFASGTLFLVLLWNMICGEVWGHKEQLYVFVCVYVRVHVCVCGYGLCVYVCLHVHYRTGLFVKCASSFFSLSQPEYKPPIKTPLAGAFKENPLFQKSELAARKHCIKELKHVARE